MKNYQRPILLTALIATAVLAGVFVWSEFDSTSHRSGDPAATGSSIASDELPGDRASESASIESPEQPAAPNATPVSKVVLQGATPTYQQTQLAPLREIISRYGELASRAERGDMQAATDLWRSLGQCQGAPRTPEQLNERVAEAQSKHLPDYFDTIRDSAAAYYQACAGITDQQLASGDYWVAKAAALGDSASRLEFVLRPPADGPRHAQERREYDRRANEYLELELGAGNPEALRTMSRAYSRQDVLGMNRELEYAYLHAYSLATPREGASARTLYRLIDSLESQLNPSIVAAGREQGETIFRKCCGKP